MKKKTIRTALVATRPGSGTMEAARGNGYAPVPRGLPVMMSMIFAECINSSAAPVEEFCKET